MVIRYIVPALILAAVEVSSAQALVAQSASKALSFNLVFNSTRPDTSLSVKEEVQEQSPTQIDVDLRSSATGTANLAVGQYLAIKLTDSTSSSWAPKNNSYFYVVSNVAHDGVREIIYKALKAATSATVYIDERDTSSNKVIKNYSVTATITE